MAARTQSRAPGVYLEEVTRRPEPALETGVPVFLGRLREEREELLHLDYRAWVALEERDRRWAEGQLGFAVRGFFENGGRRCYVAPLGARSVCEALEPGCALEALDDFDLLCAPDSAGVSADQACMLRLCDRRPGCFALLDAPAGPVSPAGLSAAAASVRDEPRVRECPALLVHGALYGPWIKVLDANAGQRFVPPSGQVAGVIARTDERVGPHKAPANEPLEGVFDVELQLDDAAVSSLGADGVNCIRALPARGVRVWGARTLAAGDTGFTHVNARRVYLTVLRWLEWSLADAAFEPNDYRLWLRIDREVNDYLEELFRKGALLGASPAEAFHVKCDAETNPPSARERGLVVAEVGFALARPAEFVQVRLVVGAGAVRAGAA